MNMESPKQAVKQKKAPKTPPPASEKKPAVAKGKKQAAKPKEEAPKTKKRTPRQTKVEGMNEVVIEKVVVNIGVGEAGERLNKAAKVLEMLTDHKAVLTSARGSVRDFNIRKGLQIGTKVTLRGPDSVDFLQKGFYAKDNKIAAYSFDRDGNAYFGIPDYTDFKGMKYDPEIGIFGMDVAIVLKRRGGFRLSRRMIRTKKLPRKIRVTREEAMKFISETFNVTVVR
ncbi:MAG: 50S ribosomal protein L5 [Thermoplasmataceae archaeon]